MRKSCWSYWLYARHQDIYGPGDQIALVRNTSGTAQARPPNTRNQTCRKDQALAIVLEFRIQIADRRVSDQTLNSAFIVALTTYQDTLED